MTTHALIRVLLLLPFAFLAPRPSLGLGLGRFKREADGIMKRFAEAGEAFEGHDLARVHLVQGQGQRLSLRRLFKRDLNRELGDTETGVSNGTNRRALRFDLRSGPKLNMTMKKARIVTPNTIVTFRNKDGKVDRKLGPAVDCYFHGELQDSSGQGWAAISYCNGVFGFANSPGFEYYIHPTSTEGKGNTSKKIKRDIDTDDEYDIHVLWRRSVPSVRNDNSTGLSNSDEDEEVPDDDERRKRGARERRMSEEERVNAQGFVIETAMFSDAQYCERLEKLYPGRWDDFLLTRLAATQSLFNNREEVGYDVQIKVKRLEYWTTNPVEYKFGKKLGESLKSFCEYVRERYSYDIHGLNSGIEDNGNSIAGLAYVRGMCSKNRCFAALTTSLNSFVVYAHEIGHTMGLTHIAICPKELQKIGGFQGGGNSYNFSPCMKYQLAEFVKNPLSSCLFEETQETSTPEKFNALSSVFPGEFRSPNAICRILAGTGYSYVPFGISLGTPTCQWVVCLNDDKSSPEYGRARRFPSPIGFPCDDEAFCMGQVCVPWTEPTMVMQIETLRSMRHDPQWSEWSELSECSRSCGTGMKTRHRKCQIIGFNLAPYCSGRAVEGEPCNKDPCPGDPDPSNVMEVRQARGDEVCARFLKNGVKLNLDKKAQAYTPVSGGLTSDEAGTNIRKSHSSSCLLKCLRKPAKAPGEVDAFMPDGTPCLNTDKSDRILAKFNIEPRCVQGFCTEFSDCGKAGEIKDACGVCGGDGSACKRSRRSVGDYKRRTDKSMSDDESRDDRSMSDDESRDDRSMSDDESRDDRSMSGDESRDDRSMSGDESRDDRSMSGDGSRDDRSMASE